MNIPRSALSAVLLLFATAAGAQATRTWVSGVGDDANPCSRTAPCKTFAGAISKTAAGGEINAIDPGGFGAVTITKSITIDGAGTHASVLAAGTNGIVVNAGTSDVVVLRNLALQGGKTGLSAVNLMKAGVLSMENVSVIGFGASSNAAINLASSVAAKVDLTRVTIVGCVGSGAGIAINGTAASVTTMLDGVRVAGCATALQATGSGAAAYLSDSTLLNNTTSCATASGGNIRSFGNNRLGATCPVLNVMLR